MRTVKYIITALLLVTTTLSAGGTLTAKQLTATPVANDSSSSADQLNIHEFFVAVERNILNGLQSKNVEVVDSNLHHLILFKTDFPEFSSSTIQSELSEITFTGTTQEVRYKAFLALSYLNYQKDFKNLNELQRLISQNEMTSVFRLLDSMVKPELGPAVSAAIIN